MKTLAIETSCDDTSLGIVSYKKETFNVEELIAYSQIQEHNKFGGVLPEIASRLHSEKIITLLQNIGRDKINEIDFISVTSTPGLPGSLVVGKAVANMLSQQFNKPLLKINHIHGHIFSILLERKKEDIKYPLVILTASGGHNDIYLVIEDNSEFKKKYLSNKKNQPIGDYLIYKIGYTLDDAAGEAFDKVSKMLGGPYPGGPWISQQAEKGKQNPDYQFKRIFLPKDNQGNFVFSFSGMKSQVSFLLDKIQKSGKQLSEQNICDIAYEFQEATVETLTNRLMKSAKEFGAKTVAIAGGVSANNRLIEDIQQEINNFNNEQYIKEHHLQIQFIAPAKKVYSTDNAAMIGVVGILESVIK